MARERERSCAVSICGAHARGAKRDGATRSAAIELALVSNWDSSPPHSQSFGDASAICRHYCTRGFDHAHLARSTQSAARSAPLDLLDRAPIRLRA